MASDLPARILRLTRPVAMGLGLTLSAFFTPLPLHASSIILVSGDPADPLTVFSDRLKLALSPRLAVDTVTAPSGPGVLPEVFADRQKIAFAQRDGLTAFRAHDDRTSERLEIYGDVPACAVALVRRNSLIRSYADMVAARRNSEAVRVDIGAADGWTASTMSNLRALDAAWGHVTVEHRGGARALSRVLSGETDMLVVMAYDATIASPLVEALAAGSIEPAPVFTGNLVRLAALHNLPYAAGGVRLKEKGLLAPPQDYETICTSLGVVINPGTGRAIAEAVAQVAVKGGLTASHGLSLDAMIKTATSTAEWALSEARRTVVAVAEPGFAWIARWMQPAPSPISPMHPATNLKDDGR